MSNWSTGQASPVYDYYWAEITQISHAKACEMLAWTANEYAGDSDEPIRKCANLTWVNDRWGYWYNGFDSLNVWFTNHIDLIRFKMQFC